MATSSAEARTLPPLAGQIEPSHEKAQRLFRMGRIVLIATLMLAPLPYGSVQTWAWASLTLLTVLLLLIWGVASAQRGALKIFWSPVYLPAALFLLWAIVQLAGHLTFDYIGTREAVIKLATDVILFFLAGQFFGAGSEDSWGQLGLGVTVFAFVVSFLTIIQFFSGSIYNYWNYWSVNSIYGAFGPYVNRNHYAGLMEMLIPLGVAYLLSRPEGHPQRYMLAFAVLLPIVTLLLSGSRGGFISLLAEIIILGTVLFKISVGSNRRNLLALGGLGITTAAILFFWIDPGQISKRLERVFDIKQTSDVSYGHRATTALDTLHIFRDHPVTGTGVGSFVTVFPQYQTIPGDAIWEHAHNDYAEGLAETGMIGGVLIIGGLALFLRVAFLNLSGRPWNVAEWMKLGATVGALGIIIHSIFDFNLHIPANALWFAACCGIATLGPFAIRQPRPSRNHRLN